MAWKISSHTFWRLLKIHSIIFPHTFTAKVGVVFSTTNAQLRRNWFKKERKCTASSSMKIPKPEIHLTCFQKTAPHLHHPELSELVGGGDIFM